MRNLHELDRFRQRHLELQMTGGLAVGDDSCGCFMMPSEEDGKLLRIIAAQGGGWDHVSVSRADRCPTWGDMEQVKRAFFEDTETAMQLHVPPSEHINCHPYCLHLWRPLGGPGIPLPPSFMVG